MKSLNLLQIGQRITHIRGAMSKAAFARELGVSPSYIGMLEEGKNVPSDTLSELISLKFNISKIWLLTGEEPMRKEPVVSDEELIFNIISDDLNKKIVHHLDGMSEDDRREILKHIQEKKLLKELMAERLKKEGA